MRRRTRIAAVVAAALPLLAGAAVPLLGGSANARPAEQAKSPEPGQSDWPNQDRLDQAAQAVVEIGDNRYPDVYAGVELDVPADVLIVHRVPGPGRTNSAAFDQAIRDRVRALAAPSRVTIKDAPQTQAQLYAWAKILRDDFDHWKGREVGGYSIESRPGDSCVWVGLRNLDRDGEVFRGHYAFPICLEQPSERVFDVAPRDRPAVGR